MSKVWWVLLLVGAWYIAGSAVTLVVFAMDKRRAQHGERRVPERTLHALSMLGGFPGSMVAMWGIRHKNRKVGFVVVTVGIAALHIAAWGTAGYLWMRLR